MKAKKTPKMYSVKEETADIVNEPVAGYFSHSAVEYPTIMHSIYGKLHSHEEVFRKFAAKLNTEIGTNILIE
ncbi:hypothetical protein FACS189440_13520 [Bacteroidia bacterium]|nr:hypothetical protein FACS189440_13520 [Bacteroidia bacterium]